MVELQRQRLEHELTKVIDEVDKTYLRRMQGDMHRCAAKCCDNNLYSIERLQQCIESCSIQLNDSQNYVQKELQHIQGRLQRCVMDCNDSIKDKMGPNLNDNEIQSFTTEFEICATKCVDKHLELLPSFLKSMKATLAKYSNKDSN